MIKNLLTNNILTSENLGIKKRNIKTIFVHYMTI